LKLVSFPRRPHSRAAAGLPGCKPYNLEWGRRQCAARRIIRHRARRLHDHSPLGAFILLQHFNPLRDALSLVAKGHLNISSQLHRIACSTILRCSSASPCSPARDPVQGWIRCRHSFPSILPCCRLAFCHSRLPLSTKSSNISWQSMLRICWALP
jgi:hypothetical protein